MEVLELGALNCRHADTLSHDDHDDTTFTTPAMLAVARSWQANVLASCEFG